MSNNNSPKLESREYLEQAIRQHMAKQQLYDDLLDAIPALSTGLNIPKDPTELIDFIANEGLDQYLEQAGIPDRIDQIESDLKSQANSLRDEIARTDELRQDAVDAGIPEEALSVLDDVAQVQA